MVYIRSNNFLVKGLINIFSIVGHMISAATMQLRHYSTKVAIFSTLMIVAIFPIKPYKNRQQTASGPQVIAYCSWYVSF